MMIIMMVLKHRGLSNIFRKWDGVLFLLRSFTTTEEQILLQSVCIYCFLLTHIKRAGLAQSVERQALNLMVEGSSPSFGAFFSWAMTSERFIYSFSFAAPWSSLRQEFVKLGLFWIIFGLVRIILGLFSFFGKKSFLQCPAAVVITMLILTLSVCRSFAIPTVIPLISLASALPYIYSAVSYVSICDMIE